MKQTLITFVMVSALVITSGLLGGCNNTVRGMGQDMDKLTTPSNNSR